MTKIAQEIHNLVAERTRPHLNDLSLHNYSLEWLVLAIYCQALKDVLQLIEERPDAIKDLAVSQSKEDPNSQSIS